jgi:crossover junction endodeoxyribonuclease RusA
MITLELPYPVSMNAIWRTYKGRQTLTPEARRYRNEIKYIASKHKAKLISGPVSVILELRPKLTISGRASKVLIDLDNCIKATLDGLQGIIINNDRDVKRIYAYYGDPVESGALIITIEKYE